MSEFLKAGMVAVPWMIMGLVVGFDLGRLFERSVRASARSRRMNDDATEPCGAPARTPGAESEKRPFAESGDNRSGNGADDGDDDGFHANIVPQKQEAGK